jgi:hypothetical protein
MDTSVHVSHDDLIRQLLELSDQGSAFYRTLNGERIGVVLRDFPSLLDDIDEWIRRTVEVILEVDAEGDQRKEFTRLAKSIRGYTSTLRYARRPKQQHLSGHVQPSSIEERLELTCEMLRSSVFFSIECLGVVLFSIKYGKDEPARDADGSDGTSEGGANPPFFNSDNGDAGHSVFIVHGHDDGMKNTVARFIAQLGFKPIILHEQLNKGRHILTKFIEESDRVNFAVVLFSPDDEGRKVGTRSYQKRGRQNVVLELGYFISKLGLDGVMTLMKGKIEMPSDFFGVVYTEMDDAGAWKNVLADELRARGYPVDKNDI